jgi:hypothetical protein
MNKISIDRSIIFNKKNAISENHDTIIHPPLKKTKEEIPEFDFYGKIVHIVASGPSAKNYDKKFFDSLKKDNTVFIAVNHAYKECSPDIIFFTDKAFATIEDESKVIDHPAIKFSLDQKVENCFLLNNKIEQYHSEDKNKFYRGKLSGVSALSFAAKRRPEKIFLWGFDCGYVKGIKILHSTSGKYNHRFDSKKDEKIFKDGIKSFALIPPKNIFNVSPDSNLDFFEKISIEKFNEIYFS